MDVDTPAPTRMTLSRVIEMLLTRSSSERSSVTLTRNAAGGTQIEVSIRTGDDGDVITAEDAERKAVEVYERLRQQYPPRDGHDNASVSLSRNAKGETQITVEAKTSEDGTRVLAQLEREVRDVYDRTRMKYPMADGRTAKEGSVA